MEPSTGAAVFGGLTGIVIGLAIGLVIGVIAKLLMPGRDPGGWFVTCLLGIAGSWIGGLIFNLLGVAAGGLLGFVGAVLGAMLILFAYRMFKRT